MTEKLAKLEKMSSSSMGSGKPVPMKLFAAWEVDRTPPNCIPRLCSLTITRLSLLSPLPSDLSSLLLAVKMQSSKRTLRSHEIPVPQNVPLSANSLLSGQMQQQYNAGSVGAGSNNINNVPTNNLSGGGGNINLQSTNILGQGGGSLMGFTGGGSGVAGCNTNTTTTTPSSLSLTLLETELDLHFSLQYPHFIKRDGNRLVILLQRRKKYKSRTILGYKTLAEGMIRMDAVLQKSMDMTVELVSTGKNGRAGIVIATLRAERVSSIPVDHDNKNNNSVLLTDRVTEYSDDDEEGEFSSGEDNDDGTDIGLTGYDPKREYTTKHEMRKYRKLERGENDPEVEDTNMGANPADSDSEFEIKDKISSRAKISRKISFQQRNFKQKIVALLKRFKVSEEMDGGVVTRGAAALRGERELDALFQELESLSCGEGDDSGPDLDSLSIGSTPKPSLRPFFSNSRNMLQDNATDRGPENRNDSSGNEGNTGNTDPETQNSDPQNAGSPPREKELVIHHFSQSQMQQYQPQQTASSNEKRSRLFRTSSNTPNTKKKQSLSLSADSKSVLETCLSPTNVEPRKTLLDQLTRVFSMDEAVLPDVVTIISPPEALTNHPWAPRLNTIFTTTFRPSFLPQNTAEVKAILQALMTKIQKYCNTTAKPPATVKVLLLGGDWLQGSALRHYVDLLGVRPPDWVHHIRFYIVPIGSSAIARYLSSIDQSYCAMFGLDTWHQICERAASSDSTLVKADIVELTNRIQRYLHTAGPCTQIPIAEAMVNYKDEDSCQIFVPFISDVRIGFSEGPQLSVDLEESFSFTTQQSSGIGSNTGGATMSGSPPLSGRNSPPICNTQITSQQQQMQQQQLQQQQLQQLQQQQIIQQVQQQQQQESIELQIDYWTFPKTMSDMKEKGTAKGGDQGGKNSVKSAFRNLQVSRLPQNAQMGDVTHGLTVIFATKEKKQKSMSQTPSLHFMRLGKKKEKDRDQEKEQCIEGVSRLICSPKQSHPVPLRIYIDGTEWTGVKFFQLSPQWQTHIKNFPVALIGAPIACSDLS